MISGDSNAWHGRLHERWEREVRANCHFQVVDECDDWIVVEKPAPLAVHPANGKEEPTLLSGLEALLVCDLADGGGLSILTRLDRETSGLVLVAKNRDAAREFSLQFERREVEKEYQAVVHGWPEWDETTETGSILRAGEVAESPIWLRQTVHNAGRECRTQFSVISRFQNPLGRFAVVRCQPQTGRMHQIRVHLEHLGHPLVGDKIYGTDGSPYLEQMEDGLSDASIAQLILPRQALHACMLAASWKEDRIEWRSDLPGDLARFVSSGAVNPGYGKSC